MGKIFSFLGYTTTTNNSNFDAAFSDHFSCKICFEILHDPVQCQNNEHYFCRKCITKHVHDNTETCPICADQLTLETFRPPSRIVLDVVSQLRKQRIDDEKTVAKPKRQIFIFGGRDDEGGKSMEIFNWSTRTWTLLKNYLFFRHYRSFSFLCGEKIMVCGGVYTQRIEYLNPSENEYGATVHSVSLPTCLTKGVLHEKRILTFGSKVVATSLESPGVSRSLIKENDQSIQSVQLIENNVYIIGEQTSSMKKYDVTENKLTTLPSLPYEAYGMATVAYKDNIIIIGGEVDMFVKSSPLNDVVMFNVTSQEYKKLPSMLEKRARCAAVIMGGVIVVMGGKGISVDGKSVTLNTAKYYVIGHSRWQNLPAMNLAREGATACVYD